MRKVDLYFNYKYTFRFLLLNSVSHITNNYNLADINKTVVYFPLRNLIDLNDVRIYNYCFFFKFFFGIKPLFSQFKDISTYGKTQYLFNIQIILTKKDVFSVLYFLSNDVLPFMARRGFGLYMNYTRKILRVVYTIDKFNVFLVKKSNLGLMNLNDPLFFKIYIKGIHELACKKLIYFLKL